MKRGREVGDYTKTYVNALQKRHFIGVVKLIKFIQDCGELELWDVKYINHPNKIKQILIKKP